MTPATWPGLLWLKPIRQAITACQCFLHGHVWLTSYKGDWNPEGGGPRSKVDHYYCAREHCTARRVP